MSGMTKNLKEDPELFVDFLMRFHHQLAEADFIPSRAYISGLTIAAGYFLGGLVPLLPYLFFTQVREALLCSVLVMAIALFVFGWTKTALVGDLPSFCILFWRVGWLLRVVGMFRLVLISCRRGRVKESTSIESVLPGCKMAI